MEKTLQAICLPTDKASNLCLHGNKLRYHVEGFINSESWNNQYIYFTSKDEIKEGDWFELNREIFQCKSRDEIRQLSREHEVTQRIEMSSDPSLNLPLIPESFINLYAEKQGAIKEVEVEIGQSVPITHGDAFPDYEEDRLKMGGTPNRVLAHAFDSSKIKTNPDNTVIWSLKEEKMYSRRELINILNRYDSSILTIPSGKKWINDWIEENL